MARLALPAVCRRKGKMAELITAALQAGYKKWEVDNYWGIAFTLRELGLNTLNVFYRSDKIKKFESFMGKSFG